MRPLSLEECDEETRRLLRATAGVGAAPVLNIFATLAHHPKLMKRWLLFGDQVLSRSTLGPRERELLILRTGWLCRAEYEWGQHLAIARTAGLTDDEIRRVAEGHEAGWSPVEAALLRAADELHADQCISDETWRTLSEHFDVRQRMDIVFTVGQYTLVSMALNTLGVQREEGVEGFPAGAARKSSGALV